MNAVQPLAANDLTLLRIEQARMLKERVGGSCRMVGFIVFYTAVMIAFIDTPANGLLWFAAGSVMVLATYAYAKLFVPGEITSENVTRFLRGHCAVSAATGAVWSGFSIYLLDYSSYFTLFAGATLVCSITLGGVVPRSAYRATYVALASTAILPFGAYIALTAPGTLAFIGIGLMAYFFFLMFISARVEMDIRETIASQNARQLNELILARNDVYREANTDKMRFIAGLSHDLAQPLHAQGFLIEGLKARVNDDDARDLLARVEECWRSQLGMLSDLSELSKVEYGSAGVQIEPVSIQKACENAASLLASKFDQGPKLTLSLEDAMVDTDPRLLARILQNLVLNALKFTPKDGIVTIESHGIEAGAMIAICDTGPGIPKAQQDAIFKEFSQIDAAGTQYDEGAHQLSSMTGSGLGLSIVERLCQRLGIRIKLSSELGQGSRFELTVPPMNAEAKDDAAPLSMDRKAIEEPLIVVIDDDPAVLEATKIALNSWGCRVLAATSSALMLDELGERDDTPELLIVDLSIGQESGLDAIEALREECNCDIPAVLMSANWMAETRPIELANTVQLSKPIDPQAIRQLMRDSLV